MPEFAVESVVGQEEWSGRRGQMITYELMLAGEQETVQLVRQRAARAPSAGDTLDGTIETTARGRQLKVAYSGPPDGAGGAGRRAGAGAGRDDATNESIQRQTAAKCAAEMAAAVGGNGPVVLANFEEFFKTVHALIAGPAGGEN